MHWPPLALFRGECGAVQIKVSERTVAFGHSFVTVRSAQRELKLRAPGEDEYEKWVEALKPITEFRQDVDPSGMTAHFALSADMSVRWSRKTSSKRL